MSKQKKEKGVASDATKPQVSETHQAIRKARESEDWKPSHGANTTDTPNNDDISSKKKRKVDLPGG